MPAKFPGRSLDRRMGINTIFALNRDSTYLETDISLRTISLGSGLTLTTIHSNYKRANYLIDIFRSTITTPILNNSNEISK